MKSSTPGARVSPPAMTFLLAAGALLVATFARADDWPMWARTPDRRMNSPEKDPPTDWDVKSGQNIKWKAAVGSQSYGNPVIAGGLVFIGTNNEGHRDPKITADGGVLMGFSETDGRFLYQRYSAKLKSGRVNDWPYQGVCCTAFVEGDRLYYCTNRCEVVCLDISPLRKGEADAPVVWAVDMMAQLGVFPHNMTACSIAGFEDRIYVITGNGVDESHKNIPNPAAPAIVCFQKTTGKVLWQQNPVGSRILHGQWASPAIATVNGRTQVIAPLGDGWIYSFDARTGDLIWKFDSNNKNTVYPTTRNELIATPVVVDGRLYIANGQDPEHGEGPGHLWCIDITKEGDISRELPSDVPPPAPGDNLLRSTTAPSAAAGKPNPNSGVIWDFQQIASDPGDGAAKIPSKGRMHRAISTVAVAGDLVIAPDFSGDIHCFDAKTGKHYWDYDAESAIWGSPLVVQDKVYICDEDGDVLIFALSADLKLLTKHNMGAACYCSPVFANGVLYVMNRKTLFAIQATK